MTATISGRPARRGHRILFSAVGVALLAVAAFVGWLAYRHVERARDLRAALAEVEAADPRWRVVQLEADRAPVPDKENSAAVVRRIVARLRPADPGQPQRLEAVSAALVPNVRLTDEQYAVLIDALEGAESGIGPALALADYPRGRHPVTYAPDGISTRLPHMSDLSAVHDRVLRPLLLVLTHEGDDAGAVRACRATLNLGRSLGDEPFLVTQLVRARYAREAIRGAERVLAQGEVSDADLAALQHDLATEAEYDGWRPGVRGERTMLFGFTEAVRTGAIKPSGLRRMDPNGAPRPTTRVGRAREWLEDRFGIDVRPAQAWLLRHYTRLIETARLPWPERRAALAALAPDPAGVPELARLVLLNEAQTAKSFQTAQARGRSAVAAVASERCRLRHGDWPKSLTDLVPELLPAVPLDPFNGQPLRYRRLADGVAIYSVGADGTDDGGHLNDAADAPPGTDIGFRLWDVPHRRQSPEAPP
jgi:hypothetical protein